VIMLCGVMKLEFLLLLAFVGVVRPSPDRDLDAHRDSSRVCSLTEGPNDKLKYALHVSLLEELCSAEKGENFVTSPLTLGMALATLPASLRDVFGPARRLYFGTADDSEVRSMFSTLLSKRDLPLEMAHKYLADERFEGCQVTQFSPKGKYEPEIECVDFVEDHRQIAIDLNTWVANATHHRIQELRLESLVCNDVVLVILNAIHFKGSWLEAFDPEPRLLNFKLPSGRKIQKNFLTRRSGVFGYAETETLRVVKIPYREAGFYMLVAIPKNRNDTIDEIIADMQPAELVEVITKPKYREEVILSMPKFTIDYNFRRYWKLASGSWLELLHKAVIEVDEKSSEAVAPTTILTAHPRAITRRPIKVELNRPFLFMVMSEDDLVILAGICAKP